MTKDEQSRALRTARSHRRAQPEGPFWLQSYGIALALFLLPLLVYVSLIGRWSLAGDEIYTLEDSSISAYEILAGNRKPIYYFICHYAMKLPLPLEVSLRLPAAIAAAAVPAAFYLMLLPCHGRRVALYAAILIGFNPWLFELSQFARFYTLMFLLASIATLALYRWLHDRRTRWLVLYAASALLATLTHTTAAVLFPAGVVAALVALAAGQPQQMRQILQKSIYWFAALGVVLLPLSYFCLWPVFLRWFETYEGGYGNSSTAELLAAVAIFVGLQVWALGLLPLLRHPKSWATQDWFLLLMIICGMAPFLLLVQAGGGGVASRYLLAALPSVFVLAGRHWEQIAQQIPGVRLRAALGAGLLAFYVPYLMSTLQDGNHYPYREAVEFVEGLPLEDPIIAATSHAMYMHYASSDEPVHELGDLLEIDGGPAGRESFPARTIKRLTEEAGRSGRPLLLVSREDRKPLDAYASGLLAQQFAVLATLEAPRFDHRRNRLVVYEYRPRGE